MIQLRRKKSLFALDIGSYAIKLIELKKTKKGYHLVNLNSVTLPPEAIIDGTLMDSSAIADAIRELIASSKPKSKNVSTSISGHSVIIKKISLQAMTEDELADSIQWEAEQYIPFDIADVNLDFEILGPNDADSNQMDVLLVAAKKEIIDDYSGVLSDAEVTPSVIDIDSFAVQNMLELNYPPHLGEMIVVINIGAELSNINVIMDGISLFTRDVASGGGQITEDIQKRFGINYEDADNAMRGMAVDGVDAEEVKLLIGESADALSFEIARTIDFFLATNSEYKIARSYICGGGAKIEGIENILSEKLKIQAEITDPFKAISFNEKKFDAQYLRDIAPIFGVAIGLAIREEGD